MENIPTNYIFKSNIAFIRVFAGIVLVPPFVLVIYGITGLTIYIEVISTICLIINYLISLYSISIHFFYEDYLVIKYPTRTKNRFLSIPYTDVIKIEYITAPRGMQSFIIHYRHEQKHKTSSFDIDKREKLELLFSIFDSKNIEIRLNLWGKESVYRKSGLPKNYK